MNEENKKVVTRFAPSPTGMLHVGSIRTALFAYLFAKKNTGIFILRIEDTDKEREVTGAVEQIMDSLKWLGIEWDFGPDKPSDAFGSCTQSERLDIYHSYARMLLEKGFAYVDPFTEEETEAFRKKAGEEKRPFLYREHRPEKLITNWSVGKALRFKVSKISETLWHDEVRGKLSAGPEALDDFILIKDDGFPTYNFCHVVDDIEMGVTHVMRGEEFIASTPKFISLYNALGKEAPHFITLPQVLGETGTKKLSKRDGAKSVLDYGKEGYVSPALFNFLVFLGFNPGGEKELFSKEELVSLFSLERIQKSGAHFNPEKLDWFNQEYIKLMPEKEAIDMMLSFFPEESFTTEEIKNRFYRMGGTAKERAVTLASYYADFLSGEYSYLTKEPTYTDVSLIWKKSNETESKNALLSLLEIVQKNSGEESMKNDITVLAKELGNGPVLWPLRVALSGKEKSPDPFTLLSVLGKEVSLQRLQSAINSL
jgi:glutamyl-tRNA synthetase